MAHKAASKRARIGYAGGGAVVYDEYGRPVDPADIPRKEAPAARPAQADDTVYAGTAPQWSPAAYTAALMQQQPVGYAGGGAVRQNFRRGGSASSGWYDWKTDRTLAPETRARYEEAERLAAQQEQIDAKEQQRYDAMSDQEKRVYQVNYGAGTRGDYTTYQGTNDTLGGAGSVPNDPGSMQKLANYSSASAGSYAGGGAVRRGYADGGTVYDDPAGSASADYTSRAAAEEIARQKAAAEQRAAQEAEARRAAETRAAAAAPTLPQPGPGTSDYERQVAIQEPEQQRRAAETQRQAAVEQQAGGGAQLPQPAGQTEAARQAESAAQIEAQKQAQIASDNQRQAAPATPWYRQVYDGLVNSFQQPDASTGYAGGALSRLNQPNPTGGEMQRLNPYARTPAEDLGAQVAETARGSWLNKLLGGEKSYSLNELNEIQKQDPGRDIGGHLQNGWREAELKGDQATAERIQQTVRNGFNAGVSVGLDRLNNGDIGGATQAIEHSLNMFTDDRRYEVRPTTDGRVQIKIVPEKPGMGEPVTKLMAPGEFRDLWSSNGGQFDHLMHNGVAESIDILQGRQKPLYVPGEGEYVGTLPHNDPRANTARTEGGFHPDSAMGLMNRAEIAEKSGRPDPEAKVYADRARAAVRGGVPADQVHDFLRKGGDVETGTFQGPSQPDAKVGIPGAGAPTEWHGDVGFTGLKSITDPGGRYVSGHEQHVSKSGSGEKTTYGYRPSSYWENPAATAPRPYVGYRAGEARAGSYVAPTNQEDYQPISKMQGPPVPPGFQPPAPTRDIFQTVRGEGRQSLAPPQNYDRDEALRYNARLTEQQNQYRAPDDIAYQARNRQLNQDSGYAAAKDKADAAQKQAIAESDKAYKAEQAEYDRVRSKYGYYTPELAAQDKAGQGPAIRYTEDWRHLPRPPTAQEQAQDIAAQRQMELTRTKGEIPVRVAEIRNQGDIAKTGMLTTSREKQVEAQQKGAGERVERQQQGAGERVERQQQGAGERATQREEGRNLRANEVMAERRAHRQFMESKQVQDILRDEASENMKQSMATFQTKLRQGIKPDDDELANYQILKDRVQQSLSQPPAVTAPAAAPATAPATATQITSQAEYQRLPSGAEYIGPDGVRRKKS